MAVGCGTGSSIIPIAMAANPQNIHIKAFDFSDTAIKKLKEHPICLEHDSGNTICEAFVHDIANYNIPKGTISKN